MKKVQLFSENNIETLQLKINTWLAENRNAHITETNMSITGNPGSEIYAFYILYGGKNKGRGIAQSVAAEDIPSVVEVNLLKSNN